MDRKLKKEMVTFADGRSQEVYFVQTPKQAEIDPPKPEEAINPTEGMNEAYTFQINSVEGAPIEPLDPKSYYIEGGILFNQDVMIVMPDGAKIYADIYRPATSEKVPVILCWSLYGKQQVKIMPTPDGEWLTCGVADGAVSRYTKFEAADPCYWCHYGYAICNIDPSGVFNADGDMRMFSSVEAMEGYNVIEWLAEQSWCNGKVATFGNSYLGISQWNIAAKRPPHLACIAPWDGSSDIYRDLICEGGIPNYLATKFISYKSIGYNYIEDPGKMLEIEAPYFNCPYWEDKRYKVENIDIPVYCTAGWTGIHLRGAVNAFEHLGSKKKWIWFHRTWEWAYDYFPEYLEDLRRFYDRYLKDIRNGWEMTPRVRLDVTDVLDCESQSGRGEFDFPLPQTDYQKLYLGEEGSLSRTNGSVETKVSYDSISGDINFDFTFEEETELTGHFKLKLWVEAEDADDMDIFAWVNKLTTEGEEAPIYYHDPARYGNTPAEKIKMWPPVPALDAPFMGAMGRCRVSRRKLDENLSTDFWPVQAHTCDEYLKPGEIVPIEMEIRPISRIYHKGQSLRLTLNGRYDRPLWLFPEKPEINNKGNHIIHMGGKYDSYLQIPVIPPKFKDGSDCVNSFV